MSENNQYTPEIAVIVRQLQRATPGALRVVSLLLKEMERSGEHERKPVGEFFRTEVVVTPPVTISMDEVVGRCIYCNKRVQRTMDGTLRKHGPRHQPCRGSGTDERQAMLTPASAE